MSKKEHPATSQRDGYAAELSRLAVEFDDHSHRLRASPDLMIPIGAMRDAMSRAGHLLIDLLGHKFIAPPRPLPHWLSWRTCPEDIPEFSGWEGAPCHHRWSPNAPLTTLLRSVSANRQVSEHGPVVPSWDLDDVQVHNGLLFLEAVDGWVGRRCTPKLQVELPVGRVLIGANRTGLRRDDWPVLVTIDWDGRPLQQSALMFMRLGPACATACRYLADLVSGRTTSPVSTVPSRWVDAAEEWRRYAQFVPGSAGRPARMYLRLSAFTPWPDKGVATQPCEFETDPSPSPTSMLRMEHDPTVMHFRPIALELANACGDLAAELDRHRIDPTLALELQRAISRRPVCPTVEQSEQLDRLTTQAEQLKLRMAAGVQDPAVTKLSLHRPKPPTLLAGWHQILPAVGLKANDRNHRGLLKRTNKEEDGPIRILGNVATVGEAELLAWWTSLRAKAEAAAARRTDAHQREATKELENPGVRKDLGFHQKSSPNKLRRKRH